MLDNQLTEQPQHKDSQLEIALVEMPYMAFFPLVMIVTLTPLVLRDLAPHLTPLARITIALILSVIVMAVQFTIMRWTERLKLEPSEADAQLTQRAQEIAQKLGAHVREVRICYGYYGKTLVNAHASIKQGIVTVTRMLVEVTSSEELDFMLAHEVGHFCQNHDTKRRFVLALSTIPLFVMLMYTLMLPDIPWKEWWFWTSIAVLVAAITNDCKKSDHKEEQADQIALGMTRNLEAAESCLRKLVESYERPGTDISKDKELNARLEFLRKVAEEIGIS